MLRIHQSSSVSAAKSYYSSGLESEGYYSKEGGSGLWFGDAAAMLGLEGQIKKSDFDLLCENKRPGNRGKLNPRHDRRRKVGYDFTFSAPKSVSILYEVLGDGRIANVFTNAVRETMKMIEKEVEVRVRKGGEATTRRTGNLVYGEFVHHSTRPILLPEAVEATVDPALHCHCYVFNTTYDEGEKMFKAAELFPVKRDAPYFEAIFHSKLAMGLARLGYGIKTKAVGFDILGVGERNIEIFSSRTKEIEQLAVRLGVSNNAKAKAQLGARSRRLKNPMANPNDIAREWKQRIDRHQLSYHRQRPGNPFMSAKAAVDLAIEGSFERRSVLPFRRLVASALRAGLGATDESRIIAEIRARDDLLVRICDGVEMVTTREILAEETRILRFLRETRGTVMAINPWHDPEAGLDEDQRDAVAVMLRSNDRVFVIDGKAGTGKTSMMKSAISAMEMAGKQVRTFAPTSRASHDILKGEGFENSETVQLLLRSAELQGKIESGSVLWIDEAGLLSTKDLAKLVDIAQARDARIIFSGDRFQHHSVERGDALRLIVESGLVECRRTRSIYRQRNAQHREAVRLLSTGNVADGMSILESMGTIHEVKNEESVPEAIAKEYVESLEEFGSVLVVSPTHAMGRRISDKIRALLIESGVLSEEFEMGVLRNRNLTQAERCDHRYVMKGDVIRFVQNAKGDFKKGERWTVAASEPQAILVSNPRGEKRQLAAAASAHYQVFWEEQRRFAVGDLVRPTTNLSGLDGGRLFNGSVYRVTGILATGFLELEGRYKVPRDSGLLDHGYVSTSHASQGRTVDKVIVSQMSHETRAASMEQAYVSISRSRDAVSIWTDDKAEMLRSIVQSDERMLATELLRLVNYEDGELLMQQESANRKEITE